MCDSVRVNLPTVDQPERTDDRLATQEDIRRDIEIVENIEFLMNERNAEPHGFVDSGNVDCPAIHENFPCIGLINPTQDFHQRGLTRSVFAAQRNDLAAFHFNIYVIQSHHAGKPFGNPAHLEQGRRVHAMYLSRNNGRPNAQVSASNRSDPEEREETSG